MALTEGEELVLAALVMWGRELREAENEFQNARFVIADRLEEGLALGMKLAPMARAAGVSRPTAYKLLRQNREHAEAHEELERIWAERDAVEVDEEVGHS